MAEAIRETIGCDLGDKYSELFIARPDGTTERPDKVKTTQAGMKKFFTRPPAHVVIENCTHSRWVSSLLTKLGHQVTVANSRRVQLISQSDSKSDRTDSEFLARLGRADVQLLAPIRHRADQTQADLAVPKARDSMVRCRTRLVLCARGLAKSFGVRLKDCTAETFHKHVATEIPENLKPAIDPLLKALETLTEQIRQHDRTINAIAKSYPDVEVISQVNGIGVLTALVFMLTLEDKTRFKKSRMVGAFFGLRPKRDQSGETDKQLSITKAGDSFTRRLLVQAANYILGPFGKDSDLKRWATKLAERGGKRGRQRATVALARKLAVLMHRLWVTGEVYEPLGYSSKRAA
jgi:transposase